jgi:hypothetical protein
LIVADKLFGDKRIMGIESLLVPIAVAILSSYLTYFFTVRSKKEESILKFKEEKYVNLLIHLQGFVGATVSGDTKRKFFEEQYKSWLYASDGVVKAMNEMIQLIIRMKGNDSDQESGRKAVGKIVLEMRKDLLGSTSLEEKDFRYTDVI